jgi:hypothetical protein
MAWSLLGRILAKIVSGPGLVGILLTNAIVIDVCSVVTGDSGVFQVLGPEA